MKNMVTNKVCHMPIITTLAIALSTNKTFFSCHLFNKDGEGLVDLLKGEKLDQTLLKYGLLCSPSVCFLIVSLKHHPSNSRFIDYILKLKALFGYNYIQDNCFLGQLVGHKVYLFKMSVNGSMFGFDLVR
jgi:hypothetical protein